MNDKPKKHVYVDAELADKIEQLKDAASLNAVVEEHFDESKKDMGYQVEALDNYVKEYRGLLAKASRLFGEACDEVTKKSYEVWESFDEKMPYIEENIKDITGRLKPINKELDEIEKRINAIPSAYRLKEVVELIERISTVNPKTLSVLEFLVNHYTEKEE
jgi:prefoldin subunit 5